MNLRRIYRACTPNNSAIVTKVKSEKGWVSQMEYLVAVRSGVSALGPKGAREYIFEVIE